MELFKTSKHLYKIINFIKIKKIVWLLSITLCLLSIISLFIKGLNLSLEFVGGTQLEIKFDNPVKLNEIIMKLERANFKNPKVQYYGSSKDLIIRLVNDDYNYNGVYKLSKKLKKASISEINLEKEYRASEQQKANISHINLEKEYLIAEQILAALNANTNKAVLRRVEYVGSEVGEKLLEQGGIAVIIAILVTMLYIAIRFEFRLAISAAITLFHNAFIVLGCFSIMQYEFDLATLAAILAVIGYSLNDTIVIFDRIRENLRQYHKQSILEIVNISINQTLSRTTMTSVLTLLVVLSLLFFGGQSLFGFSLALTVGIIIGTYASIFLAGTLAVLVGLSRQDFLKR